MYYSDQRWFPDAASKYKGAGERNSHVQVPATQGNTGSTSFMAEKWSKFGYSTGKVYKKILQLLYQSNASL